MSKEKNIVVGFDVGGAHLKVVRAENGRIVAAQTFATPLWQGLDTLEKAFGASADLCAGASSAALTMTGPTLVTGAAGFAGSDALVSELQRHVKGQLAPYEYPKEIEFIDALPMTTTGKVQRKVLRLQEEERARQHAAR